MIELTAGKNAVQAPSLFSALLARLHSKLSWVTGGGGPRSMLLWAEGHALMMGLPLGRLTVQGVELRGMIEATGLNLPINPAGRQSHDQETEHGRPG